MKTLDTNFKWLLLIVLTFLSYSSFGQLTVRQKRNLDAFTTLYGYVRFFHPSDESNNINQARLAAYGSMKMLSVKDDSELIKTLNEIFLPIAPSIKISLTKKPQFFDIKSLIPPNSNFYNRVYWQHMGINPYVDNKDFFSKRLNRPYPFQYKGYFFMPLTDTLNLSAFVGDRFNLSCTMKVPEKDFNFQKLKIEAQLGYLKEIKDVFYSVNSANSIVDTVEKKQVFSGIIDKNHQYAVWGLSTDNLLPFSIDKVVFSVTDNNKVIPIPVKSSPYINKDHSKTIAKYDLLIENIGTKDDLYDSHFKIGDVIDKEIVAGITAIVPQLLYGSDSSTFPSAGNDQLSKLNTEMFNIMKKDPNGQIIDSGDILAIRFANIIMAWNVMKHSYVNWDIASSKPIDILNSAFDKAFRDKTSIEFLTTLKLMCAPLNDGLNEVYLNDSKAVYNNSFLPLSLGEKQGKIVITNISDSTLSRKIALGDELLSVKNIPVRDTFQNIQKQISGSEQWKKWRSFQALINGPENSLMKLTISHHGKSKNLLLKRDEIGVFNGRIFVRRNNNPSRWVTPSIYYLNLANDSIAGHKTELKSAKAIIFDLRNDNLQHDNSILNYFVKYSLSTSLMSYPEIDYPDYKDVKYKNIFLNLSPKTLFNTWKLYFITDASTTGALENLALLIKKYRLGKIIGSNTAGAYTGANTFRVLGDYSISFTGLKINSFKNLKLNSGVPPDILVQSSSTISKTDKLLKVATSYAQK